MDNWKEYQYSNAWSGDSIVYRPMLGLKIFNGKDSHECLALADSGGDVTIVDSEFADILGIDLTKCEKRKLAGIVGSPAEAYIAPVELQVEGFSDVIKADILFVKNLHVVALLGQGDFFQHFKVRFEKKNRKFYLAKEA